MAGPRVRPRFPDSTLVVPRSIRAKNGANAGASATYLTQPGDTLDVKVVKNPGLKEQSTWRPMDQIRKPFGAALDNRAEGLSPALIRA
jgi:hypothetical protein